MNDICKLSGVQQAQMIREKQLSPVEVADAALEQIEALDSTLHAFCTVDAEGARKAAKEAETQVMRGETEGKPLLGVPFGVKDMICTKGMRTTFGSKAYENYIPDCDDIAVARMKAAGAILIGKTNTPEFAYEGVSRNKVFPETVNPWDITKTCGGSSGGSAVAAATGMTALTLGNDGGGSVRIPTSFCGVYGIKPSFGRVPLFPGCRDPRWPGGSSWEGLEAIGPITRCVEDAALMMSVLAGPDPMDRHCLPAEHIDWMGAVERPEVKGLRIAYWSHFSYCTVDPAVSEVLAQAVEAFRRMGAIVEEVEPPITENPGDAFWGVVAANSDLTGMRKLAAEYGGEMGACVRNFVNRTWTAEQLTDAHFVRQKVNMQIRTFMKDYDLLLTPTLTTTAFDLGLDDPAPVHGWVPDAGWTSFTFPFNLTGQPAATVPAGFTEDGLPVGLQIVGQPFGEAAVLRASAAFEHCCDWRGIWPELVTKA